nr:hypothetical protein [Ktedonobacterales bacterium]
MKHRVLPLSILVLAMLLKDIVTLFLTTSAMAMSDAARSAALLDAARSAAPRPINGPVAVPFPEFSAFSMPRDQ